PLRMMRGQMPDRDQCVVRFLRELQHCDMRPTWSHLNHMAGRPAVSSFTFAQPSCCQHLKLRLVWSRINSACLPGLPVLQEQQQVFGTKFHRGLEFSLFLT